MHPTVTLIMIVRNEADILEQCLASAAPWVDRIVVVDTGSNDESMAIAQRYQATVLPFVWQNDFAAARNFGLANATGDWFLILDADEELVVAPGKELRPLLEDPLIDGYLLRIYNLTDDGGYVASASLRLFRNHPEYRYRGALHEQLDAPQLHASGRVRLLELPLAIRHYGYLAIQIKKHRKTERNMAIAQTLVAQEPVNGFYHFNLGMEYFRINQLEAAYPHLLQGYRLGAPGSQCASNALLHALQAARLLKRWPEWQPLSNEGLDQFPDYTDLWYERAVGAFGQGDHQTGFDSISQCLRLGDSGGEYIANGGCGSWKAWGLLGAVYEEKNELAAAFNAFQTAVRLNPQFKPNLTGLVRNSLPLLGGGKVAQVLIKTLDLPDSAWMQIAADLALAGAGGAALTVIEKQLPDPKAPEVAFVTGLACMEAGKLSAAFPLLAINNPNPANPVDSDAPAVAELAQLLAGTNSHEPSGPRLSLCMIVRNEADCLRNCLESVAGVIDELIIVDTGSTDATLSIAREFAAKITTYPWSGDFAAARNCGLELASGDWIFYLDADETLQAGDGPRLRQLLADTAAEGYFLLELNHLSAETDRDHAPHLALRLFRNRPEYRFSGRIHESLDPKIASLRQQHFLMALDVRIHHYGYLQNHPKLSQKMARNLQILLEEIEAHPDDAFTLFNLGTEYFRLGQYHDAYRYYAKALCLTKPQAMFFPRLVKNSVISLFEAGQFYEAKRQIWRGLADLPDYNDLFYLWGVIYQQEGQWTAAIQCFTECVFLRTPPPHYNSVEGIEGYRAHIAIAHCYRELGRPELEAKALIVALATGGAVDLAAPLKKCLEVLPNDTQSHIIAKLNETVPTKEVWNCLGITPPNSPQSLSAH